MTTAEQLIEDFDTYGISISDDKLVDKCLELCSQYDIDGENLAICWMAFAGSNGHSTLDIDLLEQFERDKLAKEKKSVVRKVEDVHLYDIHNISSNTVQDADDDDDLLAAYGGTPTSSKHKSKRQITPDSNLAKRHVNSSRSISASFSSPALSPSVGTPSQKYSSRVNAGGVVTSYGNTATASWTADKGFVPQVRVMAMNGETPLTKSYKYMFEKLRDAAEVLDDTITSLGEVMKELLEVEEYSSVKNASNEVVSIAGRICCDSVGRLNAASVLLEDCRESSGGRAVPVDLSQLGEFSLFPGQIVGVKGINTTGNKLVVKELIPGRVLPLPDSPVTISNTSGPVQIMIGCGPFTTTDNLLYEPLTDLLTAIQENPPHFLILMGPLLDATHPHVISNELNETHESVFNRCIKIITSTLENIGTQVILVSSNRDICSHMAFPTPPYNIGGHIACVSDPALLDIEGVVIAVTSTDILFHLGKEEISFPPQGSDRLGRLTSHLFRQQSLYPLYPPPEGMCIDLDQLDTHARLPCTPHLLVLPSDLRYFIRDVEDCVVVNPERLAKGLVGGTYARIELHPPTSEKGTMALSFQKTCTTPTITAAWRHPGRSTLETLGEPILYIESRTPKASSGVEIWVFGPETPPSPASFQEWFHRRRGAHTRTSMVCEACY